MCKQGKTGYTQCPHVHADGTIELCAAAQRADADAAERKKQRADTETGDEDESTDVDAGEEDGNNTCARIETYWRPLKIPGRCYWCREQEREDKGGKTWGRGRVRERPGWLK